MIDDIDVDNYEDDDDREDDDDLSEEELIEKYKDENYNECICGYPYCKKCNRDIVPLSEEQEDALSIIENSYQISINNQMYEFERLSDDNDNPILNPSSRLIKKYIVEIRDVKSVDGKIIHCTNIDSVHYVIKVDESGDVDPDEEDPDDVETEVV